MNIVHFTTGRINPAAAKVGLVNVIYWLAREQTHAGQAVSVVVMPQKTDYENVQNEAFQIREYGSPRLGGVSLDPECFEDIDKGRLNLDIAHLHGIWSPAMAMIGEKLHRRGIPYVVSSHGSFSPLLLKKPWIRKHVYRFVVGLRLANRAAFVHLHSPDEVLDAKSFGVTSKLVVAEQGINMGAIPDNPARDWLEKRYPHCKDTFKVVFLGRLDPWHKGVDLLLRATAIALRTAPDVTLFLIGPEKRRYRREIPKLISRLGLAERVVMAGPLYEPAEKYGALSSADCFALTSRFEGFPLTVLEAMGCGTPVIVTPGTNAAEIVRSGGAGTVCAPHPDAISTALLQMKSDESLRGTIRASARKAASQYTWARAAAVLTDAYAEARKGL